MPSFPPIHKLPSSPLSRDDISLSGSPSRTVHRREDVEVICTRPEEVPAQTVPSLAQASAVTISRGPIFKSEYCSKRAPFQELSPKSRPATQRAPPGDSQESRAALLGSPLAVVNTRIRFAASSRTRPRLVQIQISPGAPEERQNASSLGKPSRDVKRRNEPSGWMRTTPEPTLAT